MKRLRAPLPAAHALLIVVGGSAYLAARIAAGPVGPVELFAVFMALEFVVQPVSTLIHELGHAVVARRVSGKPVSIMIGRGPWLRFSVDRVRVNFSVLPSRGVMMRGVCRYDSSDVSWRRRGLVALAGPAATLLELLLGSLFTFELWPAANAVVRYSLLLSLVGLAVSLVVNLVPKAQPRGPRAGVAPNDGWQARVAFRLAGQGAPLTAGQQAPGPARGQVPAGAGRLTGPSEESSGSSTGADAYRSKFAADSPQIGGSVPPPAAQTARRPPAQAATPDRTRSRVLDISAGFLLGLAVLAAVAVIARDHAHPGYLAAHRSSIIFALSGLVGFAGLALYFNQRRSP